MSFDHDRDTSSSILVLHRCFIGQKGNIIEFIAKPKKMEDNKKETTLPSKTPKG